MKVTPPTISDEVKEFIMGIKYYEAAVTNHLQSEGSRCGGIEINKMTEILTKL
jgi:hypothetical protein